MCSDNQVQRMDEALDFTDYENEVIELAICINTVGPGTTIAQIR